MYTYSILLYTISQKFLYKNFPFLNIYDKIITKYCIVYELWNENIIKPIKIWQI